MKKSSGVTVSGNLDIKCPRCSSKNVLLHFDCYGPESFTDGFHYQCQNCGNIFHFYFETPTAPNIDSPHISSPPKIEVGRYGWECPKCGAVMAPDQVTCVNCRGEGWNKWA